MLEMRPGRPEEVPAQKALWKAAFGDEDRYIDWFYECCGASADVLEVVEEGRLASMLALLPQTLILPGGGTASGWYIYALATAPGRAARATAGSFSASWTAIWPSGERTALPLCPPSQACSNSSVQWALRPAFPPGSWSCSRACSSPRRRVTGQNPWSRGVQRHPAPPAGGGARRGLPGGADPLPAGHGPPVGGGLYRLSVDGGGAAPPPSTPTGRVCCSRSCCCPRTRWAAGWRRWNGCSPGALLCAHPCPVGWHEG